MSNQETHLQSIPTRRLEGLHATETADEVLIYDLRSTQLHSLNAASAAVWRAIDGTRTVGEIQQEVEASTADLDVLLAMQQLSDAELLEMRFTGVTRRSITRKAVVGAVAIPAIISISAPLAASAATGGPTIPTNPTEPT